MAANTAEVRETALSLDAAFSDEHAALARPAHIARGREESRHVHVRRDHTRIVAAALIVSAIGCLRTQSLREPHDSRVVTCNEVVARVRCRSKSNTRGLLTKGGRAPQT